MVGFRPTVVGRRYLLRGRGRRRRRGKSGTVTGTATHNDKPLTGGTVNFISKSGAAAVGTVDATGAYKVDGQL